MNDSVAALHAAAQDDGFEVAVPGDCDTNITCARISAAKLGLFDVACIICAFCRHGSPVLGSLVHSSRPETFLPYRLIISWLLEGRVLGAFIFDNGAVRTVIGLFGIRVSSFLFRVLPSVSGFLLFPDGSDTKFSTPACRLMPSALERFGAACPAMAVPYFHAAGHNLPCQYTNGAVFTDGIARNGGGEGSEGAWAKAKTALKPSATMGLSHRHDAHEFGFYRIATDIQGRTDAVLFSLWDHNLQKQARLWLDGCEAVDAGRE